MDIQLDKRLITRQEYHKMAEAGILSEDDKVELINGEIINMSPIGSKHAAIVSLLSSSLHKQLEESFLIWIQNPIVLNDTSEPEPDLVVLSKREDHYLESHPKANDVLLVIEVASSSLLYDKEIKSSLYAQSGIPEYWIVNIESDQIIQMSGAGKQYPDAQTFGSDEIVKAQHIDFSVCLREVMGA